MGPLEQESLASLIALGFRFSMDHVTDLRIGPRDLSDLGVRFVKIPAALLLSKTGAAADIHAAELSDLLGRHGVSLIAERIEAEASVVDLLDYDVRFGQGFLFSPPRPVRAEALQGNGCRCRAAGRAARYRREGGDLRTQLGSFPHPSCGPSVNSAGIRNSWLWVPAFAGTNGNRDDAEVKPRYIAGPSAAFRLLP